MGPEIIPFVMLFAFTAIISIAIFVMGMIVARYVWIEENSPIIAAVIWAISMELLLGWSVIPVGLFIQIQGMMK